MPTSSDDIDLILAQAIGLDTGARRDAFLEQACAGDPELLDEVRMLVEAHLAAGDFLEAPIARLDPAKIGSADPPSKSQPKQLGPYRIVEQIGEGGMGDVYLAEQLEPVRRSVAVKIIKPGMSTRQVIARFAAEQQALAMMEHENIAKVFDSGTTDSNRPYFAMELVRGPAITEYCKLHDLGPRERIELFIPVCRAIQHAHHRGIIHRDIKPSNVLISEDDDRAVPKVIDFGIAKAVDAPLTEKTVFTAVGLVIGTFEYLSPERADLGQVVVDTRSDVYSLGVLLYELLTGSTPHSSRQLREASFSEMLRIIREVEPPKPSTRLSSISDTKLQQHANGEPSRSWQAQVGGDLDWIVMKALEKDRQRRYQSAGELMQELQRYLAGEAVDARPPSTIYRVRMFARRHRLAISMLSGIAVVLVAATVTSTLFALRALRAESRAVANEQRALASQREAAQAARDAHLARDAQAALRHAAEQRERIERDAKQQEAERRWEAEAVAKFIIGLYENPAPTQRQEQPTMATILERGEQRVSKEFSDPRPQADILDWIGKQYALIGMPDASVRVFRRVVELHSQQYGAEHPRTLQSMNLLAMALSRDGHNAEAATEFLKVFRITQHQGGGQNRASIVAALNLATVLLRTPDQELAVELLEELVPRLQKSAGPQHESTLVALNALATGYSQLGRHEQSLGMMTDLLQARVDRNGKNHLQTLIVMNNVGANLRLLGRHLESASILEEALELSAESRGRSDLVTFKILQNLKVSYAAAKTESPAALYTELYALHKEKLDSIPLRPEP